MPPGLIVSAPRSGAGKTTLSLGLMRALRMAGLVVQPFKSGPDYIDPAFHAAAAGRASFNLDSWSMREETIGGILGEAAGADIIVAEGSMGLFDGVARPGASGIGASADLAAMTGWPVVLVMDVSGQAQSAAAMATGFANFRPGVSLAGVVLNQVSSARHEALVRDGMERAGINVLGALPRREAIALPERHLGLVQAEEQGDLEERMAALATLVGEHVDLEAVRAGARPTRKPGQPGEASGNLPPPPGGRIALARDAAFSFVYPHLLAHWRAAGATLLPFSPLADEAPDASADVVWLPGGYPELHAGRLAAAGHFREGLKRFAERRPVHGECGGYMVLGAGLVDAKGARHEMVGLLGLETSFAKRRMHLGYRVAELVAGMPGCGAGTRLRGHEFHYSTIIAQPDAALAKVVDATTSPVAEGGSWRGRVSGTYFHLIAEAEAA
ncbi:MAG: cobyrinate a,c-diamide synthase [Rhizobiales bacterium]|nr:cobyrinate a,c-diamide synthase [Hyphomicrobiales bacterium]